MHRSRHCSPRLHRPWKTSSDLLNSHLSCIAACDASRLATGLVIAAFTCAGFGSQTPILHDAIFFTLGQCGAGRLAAGLVVAAFSCTNMERHLGIFHIAVFLAIRMDVQVDGSSSLATFTQQVSSLQPSSPQTSSCVLPSRRSASPARPAGVEHRSLVAGVGSIEPSPKPRSLMLEQGPLSLNDAIFNG